MGNIVRTGLFLLAVIGFFWFGAKASDAEPKQGTWRGKEIEYIPGEILVKFKADVTPQEIQGLLDRYEATIKQEIGHSGVKVLQVADTPDFLYKVKEMDEEPIVEYAEPNIIHYITSVRMQSWGRIKHLFAERHKIR